jgi:hypothetical protein
MEKEKKIEAHKKEIVYSELRKEWWRISWKESKAVTYLLISLVIWLIYFGLGTIDFLFWKLTWLEWEWILPGLVYDVIGFIFAFWFVAISLDFINWISVKFKNFWEHLTRDRIRKCVLCSFLVSIIIAVWFLLLIIPWIYFACRLKFVIYSIVEKWLDPIEAIEYSWNITKWHVWEIFWFDLYFFFFNLIWLLCLIVWLVRTVPMYQLATARYYKLLCEMYKKTGPKGK